MATSRFSEVKAPPHDGTPARHLLEAVDRVLHFFRGQLAVVRQMTHDGDVSSSHLLDVSQQFDETVGVGVRGKPLRPEGQGARANAQILDVRQVVGVLEGLEVLLEPAWDDDGVRTASKSKKRPPTTSSDGDESRRRRRDVKGRCTTNMFVFMIIGSPPVNRMSETSSCSSR